MREVRARTGSYEFKGIKGQGDSRQRVGKNTSPRDPLLAHSLARRWTDGVCFIKGKCAENKGKPVKQAKICMGKQ